MGGGAKTTTDHEVIRQWAEDRGGVPASVKGTEGPGEEAGILRIHFPDYGDEESLQIISWETLFRKFDKENLAFLYQETTSSGEKSRFFKFIDRSETQ